MTDVFSQKQRSMIMRRVKSKDTAPEVFVRSLTHRLGYRFRLHRNDLPGNPDLVFPSRKKVIFVHGCFWHGHNCNRGRRVPKTNQAYWTEKITKNKERDKNARSSLKKMGWSSMIIWECELKDTDKLILKIVSFVE
jgi:DNA mismatch endonuclease (patch repair protein)